MAEISIIIPVYNCEKYICSCLESINNQIFKDFEVICVNDGSSDNSLNILNEKTNEYPFLKVFSKENGGAASARNKGLEYASGKYVCFVDSDDWISQDYLSVLYKNAVENNAQLSMIGINSIENQNSFPRLLYSSKKIISDKNEILKLQAGCYCNRLTDFETDFIGMGTPWDKLFLLSVIKENKLCFNTELKTGEDTFFCWNYFNFVERFVFEPQPLYNYVVYSNSLSRKYVEFEDFLKTIKIFKDSLNDSQSEITKKSICYNIFRHFLSLLKKHFANNKYKLTLKEYKIEMKKALSSEPMVYARKNISKDCLSKKEKIILVLTKMPSLFAFLLFCVAK